MRIGAETVRKAAVERVHVLRGVGKGKTPYSPLKPSRGQIKAKQRVKECTVTPPHLFFFFTALILYMTRNDKLLHRNCIFGILNKKNRPGPPRCAALQNGFFVKNDEKADFLSLSVPPGIPALALLSLECLEQVPPPGEMSVQKPLQLLQT